MNTLAYHASVREHLQDLADLDAMVGPSELICGWFDDLYHPNDQAWQDCFTPGELAALADFHAVFSSYSDSVSYAYPDWKASPAWQIISGAARAAIARFDSHAV